VFRDNNNNHSYERHTETIIIPPAHVALRCDNRLLLITLTNPGLLYDKEQGRDHVLSHIFSFVFSFVLFTLWGG
jgi:hypothetical protein